MISWALEMFARVRERWFLASVMLEVSSVLLKVFVLNLMVGEDSMFLNVLLTVRGSIAEIIPTQLDGLIVI